MIVGKKWEIQLSHDCNRNAIQTGSSEKCNGFTPGIGLNNDLQRDLLEVPTVVELRWSSYWVGVGGANPETGVLMREKKRILGPRDMQG